MSKKVKTAQKVKTEKIVNRINLEPTHRTLTNRPNCKKDGTTKRNN